MRSSLRARSTRPSSHERVPHDSGNASEPCIVAGYRKQESRVGPILTSIRLALSITRTQVLVLEPQPVCSDCDQQMNKELAGRGGRIRTGDFLLPNHRIGRSAGCGCVSSQVVTYCNQAHCHCQFVLRRLANKRRKCTNASTKKARLLISFFGMESDCLTSSSLKKASEVYSEGV